MTAVLHSPAGQSVLAPARAAIPREKPRGPARVRSAPPGAITRRRRGIFLVEILYVLACLSIVMLIGGRMFVTSLRVIRTSQATQDAMTSGEQMLRTLREDVWSAAAVDVAD